MRTIPTGRFAHGPDRHDRSWWPWPPRSSPRCWSTSSSARARRATPTCAWSRSPRTTPTRRSGASTGRSSTTRTSARPRRTRTRFGGHGGSEALPEEKIERDPWLKRMFLGYAFSIDYRDRRGHAYMLADQEATKRLTKPQTGSCLHCHASVMPLYRELGDGDAMKGFAETLQVVVPGAAARSCTTPATRTRSPASTATTRRPCSCASRARASSQGIQALAASDAPVPHLPSHRALARGRQARQPYDPNVDATRTEMRSFVCGQCHVEYYCSSKMPLTFPWGKGLTRRAGRGVLGRDEVPRRRRASSTTSTPRPARRSSRRSTPSSSCGARASTRAAASRAPTATCPTCATARPRSPTTGCAARCSTSTAPARPATASPRTEIKARVDAIQTAQLRAAAARRRGASWT